MRTKNSCTYHVLINLWLTLYKLTGWLASLDLAVPTQRLRVVLSHLDEPDFFFLSWGWFLKFPPFSKKSWHRPLRLWQDRFYKRKYKPKSASSILQALSCQFCRLKLSNPSKLEISKKWKSRIVLLVHNDWGLFPDGLSHQKPARLALPETRPTMFGKIRGLGFWTKRITNKSWKVGTQKHVNYNRKIGRIELAESSLQNRVWRLRLKISSRKIHPVTGMCVLLCFINLILGNSYGPGVIPLQGTWDGLIFTLHLNYVAGYTRPLLYLFERTHNYYVDIQGLVPWRHHCVEGPRFVQFTSERSK